MKLKPDAPRIQAHYQPQAWAGDNAIDIDGAQWFDVTHLILSMSLERIKELKDHRDSADELAFHSRLFRDHNGPITVTVMDNLLEYLEEYEHGLTLDTLTEAHLARFKAESYEEGEPEKSYKVRVKQIWFLYVPVKASDPEHAKSVALETMAGGMSIERAKLDDHAPMSEWEVTED